MIQIKLTFQNFDEAARALTAMSVQHVKATDTVVTQIPPEAQTPPEVEPAPAPAPEPKAKAKPAPKPSRPAATQSAGETTPAGTETATEPPSEPEAPAWTLETVRAKLATISQSGKTSQVKALLTELGVERLTDLPAEKFAGLMKKAEAL